MSSDLHALDPYFYQHSSPEMVSSDNNFFFSDPFSHFCDSSLESLQEFSDNQNTQYPIENSSCIDKLSPRILSSSPPSHQFENLTLYQTTHLQVPANGYSDFSGLDALEVKTEECQVGFDASSILQSSVPHSYSGVENVAKMMQRSYSSSNSVDGKPGFLFQPRFDILLQSPNYQTQSLSSRENNFLASHLRRVCSTGDLQNIRTSNTTQRCLSSPLAKDRSFIEEANFKVGRYNAEERKERISKYRAKRNQRNFTKTIKYACRKTLADNRPRIRGRFARNDETGEIPKAACSTIDDDEDELWFHGLHEEEWIDGQMSKASSRAYDSSFGQAPQFPYYSY